MPLIDLANPSRFLALVAGLLPWLIGLAAVVLVFGLYLAAGAPDDYQQGATAKIMFIRSLT
jgi:heme exporter protein C